ncbi:hypothetical protein E4T43_08902 [Aureobasidium subglaciale]|nr:hypothetical protein E4T43_08902 [Aureobasidium subglaciale]
MLSNPSDQERTFECPTCDRSFARLEHLQRHLRTHTKERPYTCFCGRTFTRQDLLKRHDRRAHAARTESIGKGALAADYAPRDHTWDSNIIGLTDTRKPTLPSALACVQIERGIEPHDDSPGDGFSSDLQLPRVVQAKGIMPNANTLVATSNQISMGTYLDIFDQNELNLDWNSMELDETGILFNTQTGLDINHADKSLQLNNSAQIAAANIGWNVSEEQRKDYESFQIAVNQRLPHLVLPSYQTLKRYVDGYLDGFNHAFPLVHAPTFDLEFCSLELVLAIAAIGAYERFEHHSSVELFYASRTIARENLRMSQTDREKQKTPRFTGALSPPEYFIASTVDKQDNFTRTAGIDNMRALLLLSFLGLLGDNPTLYREVLDFQNDMIEVVRQVGLAEQPEQHSNTTTWHAWIQEEQERRTKFGLFCFLNLQTVLHDVPSPILCSEWQLRLPSSIESWEAANGEDWIVELESPRILFQTVFRALLATSDNPGTSPALNLTPFDCTILGLTLLQRIYYIQQLQAATGDVLREDDMRSLQGAIQGLESASPEHPSQPPKFGGAKLRISDIAAYQHIAYMRLHTNLGGKRHIQSRDSEQIARSFYDVPLQARGSFSPGPLWRSINQLQAVADLGVAYVCHDMDCFSSVPQALSCLHHGVFLSRWFFSLASEHHKAPLTRVFATQWINVNFFLAEELQIINHTRSLMQEVVISAPDISSSLGCVDFSEPKCCFELGILVLKTWAYILKTKVKWPLVTVLGHSMSLYADMMSSARSSLEPRLSQQGQAG